MKKIRLILFLTALIPVCREYGLTVAPEAGSRGDRPFGSRYAVRELREDCLKAKEAMERLHPALYEFTDRATFQRLFEEQLARINQPLTGPEFFNLVAAVVARIGCGHSRAMVPDSFWNDGPAGCFPLGLTFVRNRAYVIQLFDADIPIPPGSEIIAIQGRPMSDILRAVLPTISSDGLRDPLKWASLAERFYFYAALQFGRPGRFAVAYVPPGQTRARKTELNSVARNVIMAAWRNRNPPASSIDPDLGLQIIEEKSAAVLTIRNLNYYRDQDMMRFKSFIDSSFSKIRGSNIRNLVLDLRGNAGGSPFAATLLLSYLEPNPVPYFAPGCGEGYAAYVKPIPRAEHPFLGRLLTLVDGRCFSSTGHLLALLKFHRIGVLVGGESGGTFECHDASQVVNLPNTGIKISMARKTYAAAVEGMTLKTGVVPDDPVEPGIGELISGKDAVMEYAFALIEKYKMEGKDEKPIATN